MRPWLRALAGMCLGMTMVHAVFAEIRFRKWEDPDEEVKPKEEEAVVLPDYPKEENLLEFYVSAGTANRFFIDGTSISPVGDGAVRYALVIKTGGGSTNISYEGISCANLEYRLYATGRSDGTWSKARKSDWKPIVNKPINRYHAALSRDFFCPGGLPIGTAEEGRDALKRGRHPQAS